MARTPKCIVKLEITSFQGGAAIMQQIIGGTIDLGVAGIVPVISAVANDPTIKVVAADQNNGSGLIVKKGSDIDTIAKLKGKKIAIPLAGSIQDVMVRILLKRNSLDYDRDVTVTTVPASNMLQSLESGAVDAYLAWEPFITQAEQQNVGQVLVRFEEVMPNHPCDTIVTTTKMINDYPDTVKAFLRAHREAVDYIKANKEDAAELVGSQKWTKVGKAVELDAMEHMTFMYTPDADFIAGSETFAQEMKALGLISKDITRSDIFDLTLLNQI